MFTVVCRSFLDMVNKQKKRSFASDAWFGCSSNDLRVADAIWLNWLVQLNISLHTVDLNTILIFRPLVVWLNWLVHASTKLYLHLLCFFSIHRANGKVFRFY